MKAEAAASAALDELKRNGIRVIEIDRAPLVAAVKPLWSSFTEQYPGTKPVLQAILADAGQPN